MIAGVGPILVDHLYSIDKYPERGGHAIVKKLLKVPGGAVANVMYGLSSFGVKCRLYSTIGEDADAEFLIKSMENVGVELRLNVTHSKTGRVDVYVDKDGERTFFVHPNAAGNASVIMKPSDYKEVSYFYLDPFPAENSFEVHLTVAKNAKEFGKAIILNPGPYSFLDFKKLSKLLKYVDMLFLSESELNLFGRKEEEYLEYVDLVIVTMGKKGSRAVGKEGRIHQPPYQVKVVDTTGAGDAFAVGFLFAFFKEAPLETCLKAGNFVASHCIQYYGTKNFPDKEKVMEILELDSC
jgi:ribokinase